MYSASRVNQMTAEWKAQGLSKAEIVVKGAEARLGWPYAWGASGQDCTPDKRRYFMNRSSIAPGDAELIRKRCQALSSGSSCSGCKYYPGGEKTCIQDCQGFMKELFKTVGITLTGAGATSMYNSNTLWVQKGPISGMPRDQVCLVFKQVGNKMEHVGLHIGNGQIIHCSVEVKRGSTSEKGWTHYAIPKGLDGTAPVPVTPEPQNTTPTLRKGSRGEYVTLLQTRLLMMGYDLGSYGADGAFGTKTQEAVKRFQQDRGLTADGIVGPKTWAELDKSPAEETLYTVRIPHLHRTEADSIAAKYSGATVTKE